ncbi:hypothetical protein FALCPG4_004766 [Fusarium falciforme]
MSSLFNKSGGGSRFQLPALNLNFGSITDGTNIPPPPDSPVQKVPTPPQTPPPVKEVAKETEKDTQSNVVSDDSKETPQQSIPASSNGNLAGTKRYADEDVPLSPAASSRQGSIRRLFSRTMLNNNYAEGQNQNPSSASLAAVTNGRPSSQGGSSFLDERKSRRSSGWFRRIRTGETGVQANQHNELRRASSRAHAYSHDQEAFGTAASHDPRVDRSRKGRGKSG